MTAGQNRIPVNLDYAASTPMRAEARLAQREYDDSELAGVNPNSLHSQGCRASGGCTSRDRPQLWRARSPV